MLYTIASSNLSAEKNDDKTLISQAVSAQIKAFADVYFHMEQYQSQQCPCAYGFHQEMSMVS